MLLKTLASAGKFVIYGINADGVGKNGNHESALQFMGFLFYVPYTITELSLSWLFCCNFTFQHCTVESSCEMES